MRLIYTIIPPFLAGLLFFAYHNEFLIIRWPSEAVSAPSGASATKRNVTLFLPLAARTEHLSIVWPDDAPHLNAQHLINAYFSALDAEGLMPRKIQAISTALGPSPTQLILSLNDTPFDQTSTFFKWQLIEGLLKTIKNELPFTHITFLVQHKPLTDYHLDFSQSWPLSGYEAEKTVHHTGAHEQRLKPDQPFTIMIEPAGDTQYTGRVVDDAFERGLTLQAAIALRQCLESRDSSLRVMISRLPGETVEPLHHAACANRVKADLFIHIGFYQTSQQLPEIALYHYLYQPTTDLWKRKQESLTFTSYRLAHIPQSATSAAILHSLFHALSCTKPLAATLKIAAGIPFRPLIGIAVPAIALEIGLPRKSDLQPLIIPLAQGILKAARSLAASS